MKYSPSDYAKFLYEARDADKVIELLQKHWVLSWLPKILERFDHISDKKERIVRVTVKSVYPLEQKIQSVIEQMLRDAEEGRNIKIDFVLDKALIGGFHAESDEIMIPASLADRVEQLTSTMRY